MKKLLLSLFLTGMLFAYTPAMAQTATPTYQDLVNQLIALLTQEIAMLQKQLADMLAQQATQSAQTITQPNQPITQPVPNISVSLTTPTTIVSGSTPIVGYTTPANIPLVVLPVPISSIPPACQENNAEIVIAPETPPSSIVLASQNSIFIFTILKFVSTTGANMDRINITRDGGTDDMFSDVSLSICPNGITLGSTILNNGKAIFVHNGDNVWSTNWAGFGLPTMGNKEMCISAKINSDKIINGTRVRFGLAGTNDISVLDRCDNAINTGITISPNGGGSYSNGGIWGEWITINN